MPIGGCACIRDICRVAANCPAINILSVNILSANIFGGAGHPRHASGQQNNLEGIPQRATAMQASLEVMLSHLANLWSCAESTDTGANRDPETTKAIVGIGAWAVPD
jgi:hypothetical protein